MTPRKHDHRRSTLTRGYVAKGPDLRHDKLGRPFYELSLHLTWVDDPITLAQQTQARELAIIIDSKVELLPLFPLNPPDTPA